MRYSYKGRTQKGEIEKGIIDAMTENVAIEMLQKRGMIITGLEKIVENKGISKEINILPRRVKAKELVFFFRQLSVLFSSGVPLVEALDTLGKQIDNSLFREQIIEISNKVNGGMAFSEAIDNYPKTFSSFVINMVRIGEVGGHLSKVLEYLADHQEREYTLISKVRGAMYYPGFILVACLGVLLIMLTFVMPRVSAMFSQFEAELPFLTKMILGASNFLAHYIVFIVIGVGVATYFLIRYLRTPQGKRKRDKLELSAPIVGNIFFNMYYARISENLATLVKGGIPIVQSLDTVASVVGNSLFEDILKEARDNVRQGGEISSVFAESEIISKTFTNMVKSGEDSGKLDKVLGDLAMFYNNEVMRSVDNLMSLLEPVMLIGIAGVVLIIALAVMLPISNLVNVIK
jgi:type IV pilus assembly protein PilC